MTRGPCRTSACRRPPIAYALRRCGYRRRLTRSVRRLHNSESHYGALAGSSRPVACWRPTELRQPLAHGCGVGWLPEARGAQGAPGRGAPQGGRREKGRRWGGDQGGPVEKAVCIAFYVAAVVKPSCVFFFPVFSGRCVTSPRAVSRLPWALAPRVSNDLLTVRVSTPCTQVSMRRLTTAGRPVGGDPIYYTTACCTGPECQRASSTNPWAQA